MVRAGLILPFGTLVAGHDVWLIVSSVSGNQLIFVACNSGSGRQQVPALNL